MTRSSRASDSREVRKRQSQALLEEIEGAVRRLVDLLDQRGDLRDVHYLTIEREWVGAVYADDSRGPLFQYRRKP